MTETPKLRAFAVVLNFANGPLTVGHWVAPDEVCAAAMAAVDVMRKNPTIDMPLAGILVVEATAEQLRAVLNQIEDKPAGGVVSLVRDPLEWAEQSTRAAELLRERAAVECRHGIPLDQQCLDCLRMGPAA
jgi:hypothetical protein